MDVAEFADWLTGMERLSGEQGALALVALERVVGRSGGSSGRSSAEAAPEAKASAAEGARRKASRAERDPLARLGDRKVARFGCGHCGADEIVGWGRSHGLPRYRCKACGRTFNAATGTGMARLRKKDRWLDQAQAMIEGVSLAKAAERCSVHPTTAYRWRHRFLSAPALDKPHTLQGIVEADETFILESFKGRRSGLTRQARKRGGKSRHPGPFADNIPVLVARDRSGATTDAVLPEDTAVCITQALAGAMSPANVLVCDGGWPLRSFARRAKTGPRRSRSGEAAARRARHPHQQRQRLSFAPQGVDAPLPWRRDQEPAQLSGMAPRPRSRCWSRSARLVARSARSGSLPTANAISAKKGIVKKRNLGYGDSMGQNRFLRTRPAV